MRSCRGAARSRGAGIRRHKAGRCLLPALWCSQRGSFVALPGDEALSQTCSKVSCAGSRQVKPSWLLVSRRDKFSHQYWCFTNLLVIFFIAVAFHVIQVLNSMPYFRCSYFHSCQVSCKPGWNLAGGNPAGKASLWVMKLGKRSLARNFVPAKAVMNQANELPEVILG